MDQQGIMHGFGDARTAWNRIRRAESSIRFGEGEDSEREIFHTALTQSRQFVRMAENAEYETRPVALYYALSQAGRALCAISPYLGDSANRERAVRHPAGHGLKFEPGIIDREALLGQLVRPTRSASHPPGDSFSRFVAALGLSPVDDTFTFGFALFSLPEIAAGHTHYAKALLLNSPPSLKDRDVASGVVHWHAPLEAVETAASYPYVRRWVEAEDQCAFQLWPNHVCMRASFDDVMTPGGELAAVDGLFRYRGTWVLSPATSAPKPVLLHPLVAWWGVLYGLSMISRYSPHTWAAMLDVRENPLAPVIEQVLDQAADALSDGVARELAALQQALTTRMDPRSGSD